MNCRDNGLPGKLRGGGARSAVWSLGWSIAMLQGACGDVGGEGATVLAGSQVPAAELVGAKVIVGKGLPVCLPQPEPLPPSGAAADAALLGGSCALQSVGIDANADGTAETQTVYDHASGVVAVRQFLAGKQVGVEMVYRFDGAGRVTAVEQRDLAGVLAYSEQRSFDSAGQLLRDEVVSFAGAGAKKTKYSSLVEQTWLHGRLMSRRLSSLPNGKAEQFNWDYDSAGRMVAAVHTTAPAAQPDAPQPRASAKWTYDAAGRPVRVDRTVAGKPSLQATWTWADGSQLLSRTVELNLGVGGIGHRLDTYDAPTGSAGAGGCYGCGYGGGAGPAWADALPPAQEDCQPLATAVGHGYPEADYRLQGDHPDGLPADKAQNGENAHAYGYYGYYGYGYGYGYGGGGWLGHGGPGGNWDSLAVYVSHKSARFAIDYDGSGRMVREQLSVQQSQPVAQAPTEIERLRVFAGSHLVADEVRLGHSGDGKVLRAIDFGRDGSGRLAVRTLRTGKTVAYLDTWAFQAAPATLEHRHFAAVQVEQLLAPQVTAAQDASQPLVEVQRIQRVLDGQGRLIEWTAVEPATGKQHLRMTHAYDAAGRMAERTMAHQGQAVASVESWQFDAAGRETLRAVVYPGGKAQGSNWFERHAYNSAGRVVMHEQGTDPQAKPSWRQVSVYACP